jgi:hypothetical protein
MKLSYSIWSSLDPVSCNRERWFSKWEFCSRGMEIFFSVWYPCIVTRSASTLFFASTIQTRNSPQSNLVLYTFGLVPMYKLKSSYTKPASRPVHRRGLSVWSANTIEPRTLHLLLLHFEALLPLPPRTIRHFFVQF